MTEQDFIDAIGRLHLLRLHLTSDLYQSVDDLIEELIEKYLREKPAEN